METGHYDNALHHFGYEMVHSALRNNGVMDTHQGNFPGLGELRVTATCVAAKIARFDQQLRLAMADELGLESLPEGAEVPMEQLLMGVVNATRPQLGETGDLLEGRKLTALQGAVEHYSYAGLLARLTPVRAVGD